MRNMDYTVDVNTGAIKPVMETSESEEPSPPKVLLPPEPVVEVRQVKNATIIDLVIAFDEAHGAEDYEVRFVAVE